MDEIRKPKISIIVPVYKVEPYLHRCLDSIVDQSFTEWECILIDDGSPDNSGSICDEYTAKDNRIRVIHQKNAGVSAARNTGLDSAKGEWICFVDSDDWIEKEYLAVMINAAKQNECDLIICGFFQQQANEQISIKNPRDKKGNLIIHKRDDFITIFFNLRNLPEYASYLHAPVNKLYNASLLTGAYFNSSMRTYEDYIFNLYVNNKVSNVCFLKDNLYHYTYNSNSATKDRTRLVSEQDLRDREKFIKDTIEFAKINNIKKYKILPFCKDALYYFVIYASLYYVQHEEVKDFKQFNNIRNLCDWNIIFYKPFQFKRTLFLILFKMHLYRYVLIPITKFLLRGK